MIQKDSRKGLNYITELKTDKEMYYERFRKNLDRSVYYQKLNFII